MIKISIITQPRQKASRLGDSIGILSFIGIILLSEIGLDLVHLILQSGMLSSEAYHYISFGRSSVNYSVRCQNLPVFRLLFFYFIACCRKRNDSGKNVNFCVTLFPRIMLKETSILASDNTNNRTNASRPIKQSMSVWHSVFL